MFEKLKSPISRLRPPDAWVKMRSAAAPYTERLLQMLAPYQKQAAEWYDKREPREKLLLRIVGGLLAVMFVYYALYLPATGFRDDLASRVSARQNEIAPLRRMMRNYERLKLELASTQKRTVPSGKDFSLFSVVELTLTSSVGRSKIGSITPADRPVPGGFEQYTVEVKLDNISLAQVVDTLYNVETLNVPVAIANLQIRQHAQDSHSYDLDMTCTALGKSG
jgi:hypothetical protein